MEFLQSINPVVLILATVAIMVAAFAAFSRLTKKGVNMPATFTLASGALNGADTITDVLKAVFPTSAVVNIADKIVDYAQVGVQKAEQLYYINAIEKGERKAEAIRFVYEALEVAGIERTTAIDKIVDGCVEAAVLTLGHLVDCTDVGEGYGMTPAQ